ncbi:MAG TPA: PaaI family thioesterase, partial [Allosphingosinicella sp.]
MKGFDPELFTRYASQVGHGGALGILYVDHGVDWVELGLDYSEKLIGMPESGVIASGPIISLMDMATSMATWVKLGRFRHQATLDLRVDYMRAASPGKRIFGRGE